MATGVLVALYKQRLLRKFQKWKLNAEQSRIADLEKNLDEKLESLRKLEEIHNRLENHYTNLLGENEDVRQASIDGLELANVFSKFFTK